MSDKIPTFNWPDTAWPDFADDPAGIIAVLPLAATEQHGPHLPLGTDIMIAQAYLARVQELVPETLPVTFLPIQTIGISTEHIDYPGTLTVPAEVAIKTWFALGESVARAGLKKLVMVTSHGGNSAAMSLVAQDLRAQRGMLVVTTSWSRLSGAEEIFSADEVAHGIHGGAAETSIMLARENEMVRHQAIADFRPVGARMARDHRWLSTRRPAPFAWQAQDLHPSGVAGDARQASAENGERLIDKGAWAFCELLAEVDQFDIKALSNSPKA